MLADSWGVLSKCQSLSVVPYINDPHETLKSSRTAGKGCFLDGVNAFQLAISNSYPPLTCPPSPRPMHSPLALCRQAPPCTFPPKAKHPTASRK